MLTSPLPNARILCLLTSLETHRYVDPGQAVLPLITELTGIDDARLATHGAQPFPEVILFERSAFKNGLFSASRAWPWLF